MRFLVDMNLSPRWVDFLAAAGHEAVHWIDVGEPNAPDRVILEHAHRSGQVILTQDLDFGTLLAVGWTGDAERDPVPGAGGSAE